MRKIFELGKEWRELLNEEFQKEYFKKIEEFLKNEYSDRKIFPPQKLVFNLFNHIKYDEIKIVILGQDPYHGEGQGNGIAFSVNKGVKIPPSLRNMYKELELEYRDSERPFEIPTTGDLTPWVEQGVFLLNATLTVREGEANSHAKIGWEIFTDAVIRKINEKATPVVFILWGDFARKKKTLITNSRHLILEAVHPSPLSASRGFFGCNNFKEANLFLESKGMTPINWHLESENKKIQKQIIF